MSRPASRPYCGIDFGTSNSAVCLGVGDDVRLLAVEGASSTLPSAIFFNTELETITFGREAIGQYLDHYEGRLMRALKSILGSALIGETTQVGNRRKDFREIIGLYIGHLKQKAEAHVGQAIEDVVLGRPVHFVDGDEVADARAEAELKAIAEAQGFKNISFEFEPLAAARDYQSRLSQAERVLVVDIGGGTSDFSVLNLASTDRETAILGHGGVHIGGTDFDRLLSLNTAMRDMGFQSLLKSGLEMPGLYYHQLSTWHLINFMYTQKSVAGVRQLHHLAADRTLTARLINVVEGHMGHDIANRIETAKIALSDTETVAVDFNHIDEGWHCEISRDALFEAITDEVQKIVVTATETVEAAGLGADDIHTLFMTGGSTVLPGFEAAMQAAFPKANVNYGDRFSSVASGLGLAAQARFAG